MSIVAGMFMRSKAVRKEMNQEFKRLGYNIKEKRFVIHQVLGYTPYLSELTNEEIVRVTRHLKTLEPITVS